MLVTRNLFIDMLFLPDFMSMLFIWAARFGKGFDMPMYRRALFVVPDFLFGCDY